MKKFKFLICIAATLACLSSYALSVHDDIIKNKKVFGIQFPDETSFYGVSGYIVSVSKQEYVAGPLLVTEMSIDMLGANTQLRIYNARIIDTGTVNLAISTNLPTLLQKKYELGANSLTTPAKKTDSTTGVFDAPKIHKDYPATTHAHTLEFVCDDIDELELFYARFVSDYIGNAPSDSKYSSDAVSLNIPFKTDGRLYILKSKKNESSGLEYKGAGQERKNK